MVLTTRPTANFILKLIDAGVRTRKKNLHTKEKSKHYMIETSSNNY